MLEELNVAEIRDVAAATELRRAIDDAFAELKQLGADPIIVASCPNKFNDAGWDEHWRAVRVGAFVSARSEYFEERQAHAKRLAAGPPEARRASAVLDRLEAAEWRRLYERAFGRDLDSEELLALVIQDGEAWFVLCASNNGADAIYALPAGRALDLIGRCIADDNGMRFDQRLEDGRPLIIRRIIQDAAARTEAEALLAAFERRGPPLPPLGEPHSGYYVMHPEGGVSMVPREPASPLIRRAHALRDAERITEDEYERLMQLLADANEPW